MAGAAYKSRETDPICEWVAVGGDRQAIVDGGRIDAQREVWGGVANIRRHPICSRDVFAEAGGVVCVSV